VKRFQTFYAGPWDGKVDYVPAIGSFSAQVLVPMECGPVSWLPSDDQGVSLAAFTTGTYLLSRVCRHAGGVTAVYRWQREPGALPVLRRELTTAQLQQLTKDLAHHPDLKGDR
jgi:hypothetical protein